MENKEYEAKKRECWEEFCKEYPHPNADMGFNYAFDRAFAIGKQTETITQEEIEKAAIEYVLTRQQTRHNAKKEEDATMRDFDKTIKAWDAYDMEQAFESGANLFLGKQEKKADSFKIGDNVRVKETNQIGTIIEPYSNDGGYRVYFDDGDGGEDDEFTADQLELYKKTTESKDAEGTVIQGWVCRDKKDNALNLHAEEPYRTQSGYQKGDEPDWWESDCASFLPLDKSLFPDLTWNSDPEPVEITIKRKKNGNNSTDNRI